MKNPFKFNFLWLCIIIVIFSAILFCTCCCCESYCFDFKPRTENILLGILSSAFLLLFVEIINYVIDRRKYGFLEGKYRRVLIAGMNENGQRSSLILNRQEQESGSNIKFIEDSCYHRLDYYKCDSVNYFIELNYQYHGIYTGYVEYYDHKNGNWKEGKMVKIKAKITISLNLANKMTGSGSYKYNNLDDFGKYEFHVDDENTDRIIVNYKNTIPSGLAEGYEIWVRYKNENPS